MAKNPKLEFFKIHLNKLKKGDDLTFRKTFKKLLGEEEEDINDRDLLKKFYKFFINQIDERYVNDEVKKKAFYAKGELVDGEVNKNITFNTKKPYVHGTIKGGSYDTGKEEGDLAKPKGKNKKLPKTAILLDNFYFHLHTPLNKDVGVLVLQSYTKDQIGDIFKPFLEKFFKINGFSLKANMTPFMPKEMQDRFKENSIVKTFKFNNRFLINDVSESVVHNGEFGVEVIIKSRGKQINLNNLPTWKKLIGKSLFKLTDNNEERSLDTFNKQRGVIKSGSGKTTTPTKFELDDKEYNIKPTIFLVNYITVEEDGTPDWDDLKKFVKRTLNKLVYPEVYPEDYIVDED